MNVSFTPHRAIARAARVTLTAAGLSLFALAGCNSHPDSDNGMNNGNSMDPSRGGNSPADTRKINHPDGGADMRDAGNGNVRYSLAYPTGDRRTSVVMLEVIGPKQVRLGQPYHYTLQVENLTDTPLHNVEVDDLSAYAAPDMKSADDMTGMTMDTGNKRPIHQQDPKWTIPMVGPKQTMKKDFTGTADEPGSIHNCLSVTYAPTLCVVTTVVKPQIQITKTGPSDALVCEGVTYTYTVQNTGTGTATGVTVMDQLPDGLMAPDGSKMVNMPVGDLAAGQSKTVTAQLKAARAGRYDSRAMAHSTSGDAQSRDVMTNVRQPTLAVMVDAPEARYASEPVDYRVTVKNAGDAPALNAMLHLDIPAAAQTVPDRDLGTINPGEQKTVVVTARAGGSAGDLKLTATANAKCATAVSQVADVAIRTVAALRLECVDSVDPVHIGNTTTYTINVKNQGDGPDQNVSLTGIVPPEEEFVSGTGDTAVTHDGAKFTLGTVGTLAPKQEANWQIVTKGVKPGDARFDVQMQSASLTRPAVKSESTRVIGDDPRAEGNDKPVNNQDKNAH